MTYWYIKDIKQRERFRYYDDDLKAFVYPHFPTAEATNKFISKRLGDSTRFQARKER